MNKTLMTEAWESLTLFFLEHENDLRLPTHRPSLTGVELMTCGYCYISAVTIYEHLRQQGISCELRGNCNHVFLYMDGLEYDADFPNGVEHEISDMATDPVLKLNVKEVSLLSVVRISETLDTVRNVLLKDHYTNPVVKTLERVLYTQMLFNSPSSLERAVPQLKYYRNDALRGMVLLGSNYDDDPRFDNPITCQYDNWPYLNMLGYLLSNGKDSIDKNHVIKNNWRLYLHRQGGFFVTDHVLADNDWITRYHACRDGNDFTISTNKGCRPTLVLSVAPDNTLYVSQGFGISKRPDLDVTLRESVAGYLKLNNINTEYWVGCTDECDIIQC